jgi:uncharacterized membrane protein YphA (DoxX/SURF4 family)
MGTSRTVTRLVARGLTAPILLVGGYGAGKQPAPRAKLLEQVGLPQPELLVQVNSGMLVAAGSAIALGVWVREASLLAMACLVPTTFVGHRWWAMEPGPDRNMQRTHFLKNLSTLAALALLAIEE